MDVRPARVTSVDAGVRGRVDSRAVDRGVGRDRGVDVGLVFGGAGEKGEGEKCTHIDHLPRCSSTNFRKQCVNPGSGTVRTT
jgi:hypothetical protein